MKILLHRLSVLLFVIPCMAFKFSREENRTPLWFVWDFLRRYIKAGISVKDYVEARSAVSVCDRNDSVERLVQYRCYMRDWRIDYFKRVKFFAKYSGISSEITPARRANRIKRYREYFGMGDGCWVGHNVIFTKVHPSDGALSIGRNVVFSRNQDIDFTGGIEIEDGVLFAEGVKVITHEHDHYKLQKEDRILPGPDRTYKCPLKICRNARLGAHCIIMPSVGEIGENSVIGVGEVVRRRVPPFHMVRDGRMVEIVH